MIIAIHFIVCVQLQTTQLSSLSIPIMWLPSPIPLHDLVFIIFSIWIKCASFSFVLNIFHCGLRYKISTWGMCYWQFDRDFVFQPILLLNKEKQFEAKINRNLNHSLFGKCLINPFIGRMKDEYNGKTIPPVTIKRMFRQQ